MTTILVVCKFIKNLTDYLQHYKGLIDVENEIKMKNELCC